MSNNKCDKCGSEAAEKKRFRTGDKQKPYGKDACSGCGGKCTCQEPEKEEKDED